MSVVTRIEASRLYGDWGPEKETGKESLIAAMAESSLSYADSGSLCRIADALEGIRDVLDPAKRAKREAKRVEDENRKRTRKNREARVKQNYRRLEPFLQARFQQLKPHLEKLPISLHDPIVSGIRKEVHHYCRHPGAWSGYRDQVRKVLMCEYKDLLDVKIYGIGPARRNAWKKFLQDEGNQAVATDDRPSLKTNGD